LEKEREPMQGNKKKEDKKNSKSLPTGFIYHPDYLKHNADQNHPESEERLSKLVEHLEKNGFLSKLKIIEPHTASVKWLEKVHTPDYIKMVEEVCRNGGAMLDPDTLVGPESYRVALLAVGGVMAAVDAVMDKKVKNAFCALRPPGHHAETDKAMGFCIFNNVAVACRYVQDKYRIKKVLIIDWDVHHGNGTQNIFWTDPSVFYVSLHQYPFYPGSGSENEVGEGEGSGFTFNLPMCAGSGDLEYVEVFENIIYPSAIKFDPDFIFISAGFDAHKDDPLAQIDLTEEGYKRMTQVVTRLAAECCDNRLVSVLEGGYNSQSLASSVQEHLLVLMNQRNR
jgi:acetoin utilization deacetylase AcuC-like enzyme